MHVHVHVLHVRQCRAGPQIRIHPATNPDATLLSPFRRPDEARA
jgi:hypothetical protein